jgi:hypothetical protein
METEILSGNLMYGLFEGPRSALCGYFLNSVQKKGGKKEE